MDRDNFEEGNHAEDIDEDDLVEEPHEEVLLEDAREETDDVSVSKKDKMAAPKQQIAPVSDDDECTIVQEVGEKTSPLAKKRRKVDDDVSDEDSDEHKSAKKSEGGGQVRKRGRPNKSKESMMY